MAVKNEQTAIVRLLLDKGFDVNKSSKLLNRTSLHFACQNRNTEMIDMLILAGADVNKADEIGETALHIAIKQKNEKVFHQLI